MVYGYSKPSLIKDFTRLTAHTSEQLANEIAEFDGYLFTVETTGDYIFNVKPFDWSKKELDKLIKGWLLLIVITDEQASSYDEAFKQAVSMARRSFLASLYDDLEEIY